MKQKIFLSIAVLSLLSLAVLVSASMVVTNSAENIKSYSVEIQVTEGWNLIASGLTFVSDLNNLDETGDIKREDVKAVYVYSNKINEYISNYPEYDSRLYSAKGYFNGDEQDIIGQANWIYVSKSGNLKYQTKGIKNVESTNLFEGWNFVSITPDYADRTLNQIKGTCDWTEIYTYAKDGGEMKWLDLLNNPNFVDKETLDNSLAGMGLVIKVKKDCKLGSSNNDVGSIPSLPN